MIITKEMILGKTNKGLSIYAFILRQFYPNETVISISGRKCKPARNPFNKHNETLMIEEVDQVFYFKDAIDPTFKGDPFDFATKHFKVSGDELLHLLNKELHLYIGVNTWSRGNNLKIETGVSVIKEEPKPKRILPNFSYFKAPVTNTVPDKEVNILEVYHSIKYEFKEQTKALRSIAEKKQARAYKAANFDYVTFSGIFKKRSDAELVKHSGYLAIDFDHVPDISSLSDNLLNDEYFDTEILFTSPSGDGLKWIVSIDITENTHKEWFIAIKRYVKQTYRIEVDNAGKDVSRACFLPHHTNIYLHPKYHS